MRQIPDPFPAALEWKGVLSFTLCYLIYCWCVFLLCVCIGYREQSTTLGSQFSPLWILGITLGGFPAGHLTAHPLCVLLFSGTRFWIQILLDARQVLNT